MRQIAPDPIPEVYAGLDLPHVPLKLASEDVITPTSDRYIN